STMIHLRPIVPRRVHPPSAPVQSAQDFRQPSVLRQDAGGFCLLHHMAKLLSRVKLAKIVARQWDLSACQLAKMCRQPESLPVLMNGRRAILLDPDPRV